MLYAIVPSCTSYYRPTEATEREGSYPHQHALLVSIHTACHCCPRTNATDARYFSV